MSAWTKAHQREALVRTLELAADAARAGQRYRALQLASEALAYRVHDLTEWQNHLGQAGLPHEEIDAAVRRVDALVMGRLVREEVWLVYDKSGAVVCHYESEAELDEAAAHANIQADDIIRRVRRLRRAR